MHRLSVCHVTTVHPRYDTRIFVKQCRSLSDAGYATTLVVADGKGDERLDGVSIVDVGVSRGRINRIIDTSQRALNKARAIDADLYHFHDPELLPVGLKLKRLGKKVIFDSHEDVPQQLLNKPYLNKPVRRILSWAFDHYERWACRQFDGIVAATPYIRTKFEPVNGNVADINNFPILDELNIGERPGAARDVVCYIGGISAARGIKEIVSAMAIASSGVRLALAGKFFGADLEAEVRAAPGWSNVEPLGFLDRGGVRNVLSRSIAGLVTLHPIVNYMDALPVKMFEYMSAGIPVIASDFPLWREIVIGNDCGLCVDPMDPAQIADAIDFLVQSPLRAQEMGNNGRRAIERCYNWSIEKEKLLRLYKRILA